MIIYAFNIDSNLNLTIIVVYQETKHNDIFDEKNNRFNYLHKIKRLQKFFVTF